MKLESIGEIFYDGRVINLDNASLETLNPLLDKVKSEKEDLMNKLNNILGEIQK